MLGLLLARSGTEVVVIERHADFLRDFRGDTIHPSTQELLRQVGLLDELIRRPHSDMPRVQLSWHGEAVTLADFSQLPTHRKVMTFMPQWDFLNMIAEAALQYPNFQLRPSTEVESVMRDETDRVQGVVCTGADGTFEVTGRLVVDASGRDSKVRDDAGLRPMGVAAAMDVLWFRLPKVPGKGYAFMQAGSGMLITIDREEFLQIAYVIPAGTWAGTDDSLARIRRRLGSVAPDIAESIERERLTANDVHLLKVRLERLRKWHVDGLLCIGDSAHAMSPTGGVGINLAIQDAVATARLLTPILQRGRPTNRELHRVQRRRTWPVVLTQRIQRMAQKPLLAVTAPGTAMPIALRILRRFPRLTHITGRFVGLGARPEGIE